MPSFVTTLIDTTGRDPVGLAHDAARLVTAASSNPGTGVAGVLRRRRDDHHRSTGRRDSSVSWGIAMRLWGHGERTVYVDLDQVGFLCPAHPDASLQAANLGVIWRNVLSRGATGLIANGMATTNEGLAILRHAVRPAQVRAIRLTANSDTLWERIDARPTGGAARLINDDLENDVTDVQRYVHHVAVDQNVESAASNLGDDVIDTTNLSVEEAVEQAL